MSEAEKSWEKRLMGEPDELTVNFVQSLSIDKRLYKYDIVGSIAHAQMLADCGLDKDGIIQSVQEYLSWNRSNDPNALINHEQPVWY